MKFQKLASPIGLLLCVASIAMLLPALVDLAQRNSDSAIFLASALLTGGLGGVLFLGYRGEYAPWNRREGFVFVAASWFAMSFAGALPFVVSQVDMSLADAFFESVSGLTTTGSTVMSGLDRQAPGILLWRALLQWIGGVGIVVFSVFLFPFLKLSGQQLFALESSDTAERAFSRFEEYALRILAMYGLLTLSCTLTYNALGMSFFDAICHAMTTVSSGGYSTSDLSMAKFHSVPILWASTFFMFLAGAPFLVIMMVFSGKRRLFDVQIVWMLWIVALAVAFIVVAMRIDQETVDFSRFSTIVFTVVSIMTTTGFGYEDYGLWPPAALVVIFLLTLLGGCSGSTAGGFKVSRVMVLVAICGQTLRRMLYPNAVRSLKYGSSKVDSENVLDLAAFTTLFFATVAISTLALTLTGNDLTTALTASATAVSNVGPGMGAIVGPVGNFGSLGDADKIILSLGMLLGRLEIMSLVIFFLPRFWVD